MKIAKFSKDFMTDQEVNYFIVVDLFTQADHNGIMKTHCPKVWKFMACHWDNILI